MEEHYKNAVLYVPYNSISSYQETVEWKYFYHIEGIKENGSLTIKDARKGVTVIKLGDRTTSMTLAFQPEEDLVVSSVKYDDEDVTDQLVDNTYTTPIIDHAAVITVKYEAAPGTSKFKATADVNEDGDVDISDVNAVVGVITGE